MTNILTSAEKKECVLITKETYQIPIKEHKEIIIFKGSPLDCLSKFHRLSNFSFDNNNKFSYTKYFIK